MTVKEAAVELGVTRQTIYKYIARGALGPDYAPNQREHDFTKSDVKLLKTWQKAHPPKRGFIRT